MNDEGLVECDTDRARSRCLVLIANGARCTVFSLLAAGGILFLIVAWLRSHDGSHDSPVNPAWMISKVLEYPEVFADSAGEGRR